MSSRVHEAVKAVALCHNVTPVYEARSTAGETEVAEADQDFSDDNRTYQASSPDEVSCQKPRPRQARGTDSTSPGSSQLRQECLLCLSQGVRRACPWFSEWTFTEGQRPPGPTPALTQSLRAGAFSSQSALGLGPGRRGAEPGCLLMP